MLRAKPLPSRVEIQPNKSRPNTSATASSSTNNKNEQQQQQQQHQPSMISTTTASSSVTSLTTSSSTIASAITTNTAPRTVHLPVIGEEEERLSPSTSRLLNAAGPSTRTVVRKVKNTTGSAVHLVGNAGKGTVKATRTVGKGVANNAAKIGVRTAKGTFRVAGAVTNLAGTTVNNLLPLKQRADDVSSLTAASKTRVTAPTSNIELQFKCQKLRRKDAFTECDAFCVLWQVPNGYEHEFNIGRMHNSSSTISTFQQNSFVGNLSLLSQKTSTGKQRKGRIGPLPSPLEREVGRTEVVKGARNPTFTVQIPLVYHFDQEQTYVVRVYDSDLDLCPDLKEHDFLGGTVFTMGELMGVEHHRTLTRPLDARGRQSSKKRNNNNKKDKSVVIIQGKEVTSTRSVLEFRFSAQDLVDRDNQKLMDQPKDQFFKLLKLHPEDQSWKLVYRSEVLLGDNTPTWAEARIPLPVICNDDLHNPIKISFWDWDHGRGVGGGAASSSSSSSRRLGSVETTVHELVEGAGRGIPVLDVWKDQKRMFLVGGGRKAKKSGKLKVLKAKLQPIPTLLDYIAHGCELDLMVAVDCSSRNGDASRETGLHYRPGQWHVNDYQATLQKVGTILEPYSKAKQFSLWGYGATVRGESVNHFPMGYSSSSGSARDGGMVTGARGLLDAYDQTWEDNPLFVEPDDTAKLSPLIETAMFQAIENMKTRQCYSILCILTTGKMDDDLRHLMDTFCTAAEDAPLSIVLIGIGNRPTEDLHQMKILLGNGSKLRHSNGVPISRDNLRFAAFHEFANNVSNTISDGLKEVTEQCIEYFTSNGIQPLIPSADESERSEYWENDDEMAKSYQRDAIREDTDLSEVAPSSRRRISFGARKTVLRNKHSNKSGRKVAAG